MSGDKRGPAITPPLAIPVSGTEERKPEATDTGLVFIDLGVKS